MYLQLYGVRHTVKDCSDDEKTNLLLLLHGLLFPNSSKGSFICTILYDSTYHGLCYTSCGALAGNRDSSLGPPTGIDPMTNCTNFAAASSWATLSK